MKVRLCLTALAAGTALAVAPAAGSPKAPRAPGKAYTITIRNMAFGPVPATLHVGDAILWVNADIFQHTATAKDGRFDVDLKPRGQARTVLNKPGQVVFFCRYHPGMTGKLTITR